MTGENIRLTQVWRNYFPFFQ